MSNTPPHVITATISDTRTHESDVSGKRLRDLLAEAGFALGEHHLVRDEAEAIAAIVRSVSETDEARALIFSGGTGIAARDVTIEAIEPLLEKQLPGFGETFRRLSFDEIGARALLSRAIAGTRGKTLIIALPGSPAAVELAIRELVKPIVGHALALLSGRTHHHKHSPAGD